MIITGNFTNLKQVVYAFFGGKVDPQQIIEYHEQLLTKDVKKFMKENQMCKACDKPNFMFGRYYIDIHDSCFYIEGITHNK